MKKLLCLLLLSILLITACTASANKTDQAVEADVASLLAVKIQSVRNADVEALLSILDPEDKELQTEQSNWLMDIKANPIEDYSLELIKLNKISGTEYKAKLRQQYVKAGEAYKLEYYNKYRLIEGKLYDAGNYFEELKQGNIIIKYTAANKKLAEDVIEDMNQLYDENMKRWELTPGRPLVIKLFDDIEELRQSVKFSMWQFAGWYEYGESVKMYVSKPFTGKERLMQVISHEMTHFFTTKKSGGNLAYWLSEGIASYYEKPQNQRNPKQLLQEMNVKLMTIEELEGTELEKLEDKQQISDYYNNSHLITAFIIESYGEDKIKEILYELSKLPVFKGTTSENDKYYREYLSRVIPKVLGVVNYEAFKKQWNIEISKL